jgi:trans-aconitate 2-methyltransferase
MSDWNADAYHRVSGPQFGWGLRVLERLSLRGDELVLDVGCGTGRLTAELIARLRRGRVVAVDLSESMLQTAREHLASSGEVHPCFVRADAASLPFDACADVVFSAATLHWVLDHPRLFRSVCSVLKPGGRFVAQCGGGPNIKRLHDRAAALMKEAPFVAWFTTWKDPWEFADADTTARRLRDAGFVNVCTSLEAAPIVQPNADAFAEFVTNVICRPHLAYLPEEAQRARFIDRLTALAAGDDPAFELDYWRLNIDAVRG